MPMSKIKDIKLETTAIYQPLSDLNVRFWSQDKNTAELRFIITRNQFPLSLSKENVKVIIALESGSSFISSDDFIIDSEVEGVARYIIPTDFMRVASNVTGQIYVTTLDKEEIIVERQFKFTVSNDLLNDYPSEDKLRYIKTFDDLRNEIASRVSKLESDMETMEDYVVQVQDTTQEGITALTNLIKQKQDAYNANHTAKMKELNDKGLEYSAKFDDDKVYMDDKFQAFQESVNGSGLITTGQSKDWQKYKLTEEDGNRLSKKGLDLLNLDTGYYETWDAVNDPLDGDTGIYEVNVTTGSSGQKTIVAIQSYLNKTFINTIHTDDQDTGWKELISLPIDEEVETKNSAEQRANETLTDANQYTNEKLSTQKKVLFEGGAKGMGTSINLSESHKNYKYLFVTFESPRGIDTVVNDNNLPNNNNIILTASNLTDEDGSTLKVYEAILTKESNTKFIISNEVFNNLETGATGKDEEGNITVMRVEGWN